MKKSKSKKNAEICDGNRKWETNIHIGIGYLQHADRDGGRQTLGRGIGPKRFLGKLPLGAKSFGRRRRRRHLKGHRKSRDAQNPRPQGK